MKEEGREQSAKALPPDNVDILQQHDILSIQLTPSSLHKLQCFIQVTQQSLRSYFCPLMHIINTHIQSKHTDRFPHGFRHKHTHKLPPVDELCMGTTRDGRAQRIIGNNSRAISGSEREGREVLKEGRESKGFGERQNRKLETKRKGLLRKYSYSINATCSLLTYSYFRSTAACPSKRDASTFWQKTPFSAFLTVHREDELQDESTFLSLPLFVFTVQTAQAQLIASLAYFQRPCVQGFN